MISGREELKNVQTSQEKESNIVFVTESYKPQATRLLKRDSSTGIFLRILRNL